MRRRDFINAIAGSAVVYPLATRAQQQPIPVIGFLGSESPDRFANRVRAFRQGLNEVGYIEGRNLTIEYRWAQGDLDRQPALAADLVRRHVAVIVVNGIRGTRAAEAATATIPIVFGGGFDPVEFGLVASLSRPGGNLTGVTTLGVELVSKRIELLHELIPTATTIALLIDPVNPNAEILSKNARKAAHAFGLQLHLLYARTESDFDTVFATLVQLRVGGLVIGNDGLFNSRPKQLGALTLHHAVPTIFQFHQFAEAGGLLSYGGSIADAFRLVGGYAGRILQGEKPANLPVQQATKVELIVNLKTAKALGLTVTPQIVARADEVIE